MLNQANTGERKENSGYILKKKWYLGTKIQRDLIIYIICIGLISQLISIVNILIEDMPMMYVYHRYIEGAMRLLFCGYLIYGFWLSNCIAGPLYRLKRHMDEVAEGKTDAELKFRKNDYGAELAESFNALVKSRIDKS